jgi:hypothetical protein
MQRLLVVSGVSGQPVGPILKGQAFKGKGQAIKEFFDSLTLEYVADGLSRTITNKLPISTA